MPQVCCIGLEFRFTRVVWILEHSRSSWAVLEPGSLGAGSAPRSTGLSLDIQGPADVGPFQSLMSLGLPQGWTGDNLEGRLRAYSTWCQSQVGSELTLQMCGLEPEASGTGLVLGRPGTCMYREKSLVHMADTNIRQEAM